MLFSLVLLASSITGISAHSARHHSARHRNIARASSASILEKDAPAKGFKIVGDSGVSAQMLFLGTKQTAYILDKAENNSMTITTNGVTHPAWGTRYNLVNNEVTPMEVQSNTFCAAGMSLANGSWVVFGGNQAVTYQGEAVTDKVKNPTGGNPYANADGGKAIRMITPCNDDSCPWQEGGPVFTMTSRRWYPSVEGLADGSVIVLGGDDWGGYVSSKGQNNPTYEYWPARPEGAVKMDFLDYTLPLSLYPLVWLMPSGKLFLQANMKSILYDMDAKKEIPLPDIPYAPRVYPASGGAVMLPLTPENNYEAEVIFCGGNGAPELQKSTDAGAGFNVTAVRADDTCVRIKPDSDKPTYVDDDKLPEGRSMGSMIYLPDGTIWMGNGVEYGTAGYGSEKYSIGVSYGQGPLYTPVVYDPKAPAGSRWNRDGFTPSTEERMYHSSAILLADGSVMVSGSNPNADVTTEQWPTKYSVEKWYPSWYNKARPVPSGFPEKLSYGGPAWNFTLTDKNADPSKIKVSIIRTGFSTHGINFGQRYLELETSYSMKKETGEIIIFASQMPPNPNLFTPGPAMIFVVVDGVPSEGEMIMIGSGEMGKQPTAEAAKLPQPEIIVPPAASSTSSTAPSKSDSSAQKTDASSEGSNEKATVNNNAVEKKDDSGAAALASPILAAVIAAMGAVAWM